MEILFIKKKLFQVFITVTVSFYSMLLVAGSNKIVLKKPGINLNKEKVEIAERWLNAVSTNKIHKAILAATEIVGKNIEEPNKEKFKFYTQFLKKDKIKNSFLNAPFNEWDFNQWRQAYFFKQLANKIVSHSSGSSDNIKLLFDAVVARLKKNEGSKLVLINPKKIWERGYGLCDKQAWVLAELAYQLGYETQIVYLINDPSTLNSIHTFCEIRKGKEVWIADPYFNVLIKRKSVIDLINDEKLCETLWKGRNDIQQIVKNSICLTNSFAQDYCYRNQILHKWLVKYLGKKCPRFGEDPVQRQAQYVNLVRKTYNSKNKAKVGFQLWPVPLRVLSKNIYEKYK
ncbi:MAG: hypothetical protein GY756_08075 [bacterium]|nr:hypothetical protein [bacterium]